MKKRVLLIGATGMLRDVVIFLANQEQNCVVVARDKVKLNMLAQLNPRITPLVLDYSNLGNFENIIGKTIESNGYFDIVIAWIHGDSSVLINSIIKLNNHKKWTLHHIIGSRADAKQIALNIYKSSQVNYFQIQLGFKREDSQSRWLTHQEISDGVLTSIQEEQDVILGSINLSNL